MRTGQIVHFADVVSAGYPVDLSVRYGVDPLHLCEISMAN